MKIMYGPSPTRSGEPPETSIDFAQLTDGLRAEREQGITIDVAYRYFSTERRKFIIADTPGHEQYTRNMATGASTADLAIILIDASKGILKQSRRHVYITSLLGISHLVAAINKMDMVDFSPEVFARIEREFTDLVEQLGNAKVKAIPLSALDGDNVVERSLRTPWYSGPTLLRASGKRSSASSTRWNESSPACPESHSAATELCAAKLPRICRADCGRECPRWRPCRRSSLGPQHAHRVDFHLRWKSRAGERSTIDCRHPGRRV